MCPFDPQHFVPIDDPYHFASWVRIFIKIIWIHIIADNIVDIADVTGETIAVVVEGSTDTKDRTGTVGTEASEGDFLEVSPTKNYSINPGSLNWWWQKQ